MLNTKKGFSCVFSISVLALAANAAWADCPSPLFEDSKTHECNINMPATGLSEVTIPDGVSWKRLNMPPLALWKIMLTRNMPLLMAVAQMEFFATVRPTKMQTVCENKKYQKPVMNVHPFRTQSSLMQICKNEMDVIIVPRT